MFAEAFSIAFQFADVFAFLILAAIASGKIDIGTLLSESGGGASISRFQLLIFTFVVAISFFLVVVHTDGLPNVPGTVLVLLGISAGTYGVSKGIQAAGNLPAKSPTPPTPPVTTGAPRCVPACRSARSARCRS